MDEIPGSFWLFYKISTIRAGRASGMNSQDARKISARPVSTVSTLLFEKRSVLRQQKALAAAKPTT